MVFKISMIEALKWAGIILTGCAIGVGIGYSKGYFSELFARKFEKRDDPFKGIKKVRPED